MHTTSIHTMGTLILMAGQIRSQIEHPPPTALALTYEEQIHFYLRSIQLTTKIGLYYNY